PTPSIQPSVETQTKEKEDIPLGTILPESRPEVQEPPIDDSHQQGPALNLESANSCMGDDNAKDQETGNAESPLKENAIPEIIPEVEPRVEEVKNAEVEIPAVDPQNASKDKTSSSTDGINWEEM
ncbi:hypothetical protein A2U01_0052854, partial [Trifolium medium]|nr:hypothetical protein [Trifolium medium]